MTRTAEGTFEVTMTPAREPDTVDGVALGRFDLGKTFEGDLVGTSRGELLTATTARPDARGYVAIERFTGSVHGREGTFVLQHSGSMHGEQQVLDISIVPDSGTGALAGISGEFRIRIAGGVHHYELEYGLPEG